MNTSKLSTDKPETKSNQEQLWQVLPEHQQEHIKGGSAKGGKTLWQ